MKFFISILILPALIAILVTSPAIAADNGKTTKDTEKSKTEGNFSHIVTVKEAFIQDRYVYINFVENGKEGWLATLQSFFSSTPAAGEKIEYVGGFHIKDFESKSQKKTFKDILFVTKIRSMKDSNNAGKEKKKTLTGSEAKKHVAMKKAQFLEAPKPGSIKKINKGQDIAEIFSGIDRLNSKEVILKAKVMKVSRNILGKTWITLQDGTGKAPDNKIVAVIGEDAKAGEIHTVRGILKADVNLGSGYRYKALIDEAKLVK